VQPEAFASSLVAALDRAFPGRPSRSFARSISRRTAPRSRAPIVHPRGRFPIRVVKPSFQLDSSSSKDANNAGVLSIVAKSRVVAVIVVFLRGVMTSKEPDSSAPPPFARTCIGSNGPPFSCGHAGRRPCLATARTLRLGPARGRQLQRLDPHRGPLLRLLHPE
jgi:hypothetical protein